MNTYEKTGGGGLLLLTTHPVRMRILSERSELRLLHPGRLYGTKDLSSNATNQMAPIHFPVAANSFTSKYMAANPAKSTPLSSITERWCNRSNSTRSGLSAAVA
jgi:hypothetical protein